MKIFITENQLKGFEKTLEFKSHGSTFKLPINIIKKQIENVPMTVGRKGEKGYFVK